MFHRPHLSCPAALLAVPAVAVVAAVEAAGRLPVCNLDAANSRRSLMISMMIRIVVRIIEMGRIRIVIGVVIVIEILVMTIIEIVDGCRQL